ncbi:hypothetical protein MMC34_005527 [Xylographa carneopallida]|nr:hypothetical protein [Xylographa carneopallida]
MPSIPSLLPTPSTLTPSTLSSLLALYAPTLASHASTKRAAEVPSAPDLSALDLLRYTTIPARVRARWHDASAPSNREPKEPEDSEATDPPPDRHGWLEKEELELLVAWKLTRGHSRPTLPALVRSNAPSLVRDTTARAYALFATTVDADKADPFPALKVLAGLRGVGPATASLLLAVGWPGEVPFFADELLGWVRGRRGALRYDWREYGELWEGVRAVRERVGGGVSAEEVERGAWVVGVLGRGGGWNPRGGAGGLRMLIHGKYQQVLTSLLACRSLTHTALSTEKIQRSTDVLSSLSSFSRSFPQVLCA